MSVPTPSASPAPGAASSGPHEERWIETREGGLFFVNALFLFPYLMLLVPLLTRIFVRGVLGGLSEVSVILDTFPTMAEYLLPRMGWLAALPAWLAWKNLSLETRTLPRLALGFLLVCHVGVVAWTVAGWLGLHGWTLPGGPRG
jgi:hypothetical protein